MTGHETAGVVLHTTGGVPLVQPLSFNQEGGYYEATITAVEVPALVLHHFFFLDISSGCEIVHGSMNGTHFIQCAVALLQTKANKS